MHMMTILLQQQTDTRFDVLADGYVCAGFRH